MISLAHQTVLERIRAEYLEMPGMRLTIAQVPRLFGAERSVCQTALDSLVESKFLYVKLDGAYALLTAA
jgi:predicted phage tail protein